MSFLFGRRKASLKSSIESKSSIIDSDEIEIGPYQPLNPFSDIVLLPLFSNNISQIYVLNDKKRFVVGDSYGNLTIWESKMGTKIAEMKYHQQAINSISEFNHSDKNMLIVSSNDKTITLWDLKSYKLFDTIKLDSNAYKIFYNFKNFENDLFIVAGLDLKIFDSKLTLLDEFSRETRDNSIKAVILVKKDKIVLATNTDLEFYVLISMNRVFSHDLNDHSNTKIKELKKHPNCHKDSILCLENLNDKLFASGSTDGHMIIWQSETLNVLKELRPFEEINTNENFLKLNFNSISCIKTLYERYLIIPSGLNISIYDNLSDEFVCKIMNAHNKSKITDLLVLENDMIVTSSENGSIRIWKFQELLLEDSLLKINLTLIGECLGHSTSITFLKTITHNEIISTGYDNAIILWRNAAIMNKSREIEINKILANIKT